MALRSLKRVGLEELAEQRANTLSGGQMQRVANEAHFTNVAAHSPQIGHRHLRFDLLQVGATGRWQGPHGAVLLFTKAVLLLALDDLILSIHQGWIDLRMGR